MKISQDHIRLALAFVAGVGAGFLGAQVALKKRYEDRANEEIASVKKVYRDEKLNSTPLTVAVDEVVVEQTPILMEKKVVDGLVQFQPRDVRPTPTYRQAYSKLAKPYSPTEDTQSETDADAVERLKEQVKRFPDVPYVITEEEFADERPEYSKLTYTYFREDDVLIDEMENIIDAPEELVGDGCDRFGEKSGDPHIVYVRNSRLTMDFEIVLDERSYAEVVGGWRDRQPKSRKVKFRDDD